MEKTQGPRKRGRPPREKLIHPAHLWNSRIDTRFSQEDMAERLGVSGRTYRRWEKGLSGPTPEQFEKIRRLLGI